MKARFSYHSNEYFRRSTHVLALFHLSLVCFHFGILQILPDMLCKDLSHDELNLDSKVLSLSYNSGSRQENWSLSCVSHNETQRKTLHYDAVIMTVSGVFFWMWDNIREPLTWQEILCTIGSSVQCEGNEGYERRRTLSAKLSPRGNCVLSNFQNFMFESIRP